MSKVKKYLSLSLKCSAYALLSLGLLLGTGLTNAVAEENPSASIVVDEAEPIEEIQEVEVGEDSEVAVSDSGAPQDCVENDKRPACHVKPRGLGFLSLKFKSEDIQRCLRPNGGSAQEDAEIILSLCSNTSSRRWFKKEGVLGGGYKLENVNSGKCIERVGSKLLQRTCAKSTQKTRAQNQTWKFGSTSPSGTGDLMQSGSNAKACVAAMNNTVVRMSHCHNDSNMRWFQPGF